MAVENNRQLSSEAQTDEELERRMHRLPTTVLENAMWHLALQDHGRGATWKNRSDVQAFLVLEARRGLVLLAGKY